MRIWQIGWYKRIGGAAFVLCVVIALFAMSLTPAQTSREKSNALQPSHSVEGSVEPILIERRSLSEGATVRDERRRVTFYPGGIREGCTPWRFEIQGQTNGQIVFQVNEPDDRQVILGSQGDATSFEALIGDDKCRYRFKIELSK